MKIRSTIFKVALSLLLSSVATLLAQLILDIVIPSELQPKISDLLLSFISPITFSVLLVYMLHIYTGSGESEVCEEYPDKYPGIFMDIPRVIVKEYVVLLIIVAIGLLRTLIIMANANLLNSALIKGALFLLIGVSSFSIAFPTLYGYLLGTLATAAIYVIVYTLFRFKWRKFM